MCSVETIEKLVYVLCRFGMCHTACLPWSDKYFNGDSVGLPLGQKFEVPSEELMKLVSVLDLLSEVLDIDNPRAFFELVSEEFISDIRSFEEEGYSEQLLQ